MHLYGSLAKTGKGHATDIAIQLGLMGEEPVDIIVENIESYIKNVKVLKTINLLGKKELFFDPIENIHFHKKESLDFHPNGMTFVAQMEDGTKISENIFSVGGGFIVREGENEEKDQALKFPYPIVQAEDLKKYALKNNCSISELVRKNELVLRSDDEIKVQLNQLIYQMKETIYRACTCEGILPGGLNVTRRAAKMSQQLLGGKPENGPVEWIESIRTEQVGFNQVSNWISCFALAVNEENAAMGRLVTAPTNGAAGVIPAVLLFAYCFEKTNEEKLHKFLLIAGQIGILFKTGATISAAMGGCQAEIGVSSAMAAAALTECRGGTVEQVLMAAEIAMEHHLGLTCDPIGGLVQIPCIERNAMGAIKAVTASNIALQSEPEKAKVSLDGVIKTMWETALDMNSKYKETSEGGLATQISVNVPEC